MNRNIIIAKRILVFNSEPFDLFLASDIVINRTSFLITNTINIPNKNANNGTSSAIHEYNDHLY